MIKNTGLDLKREIAEQSVKDWEFLGGLSATCIASIPEAERDKYLPTGELQFGKEDFMDCATRAPLNILETKFNWLIRNDKLSANNKQWLIDNGYFTDSGVQFSDRFIAIKSGTTRTGNSLKAPCETIRTCGLIPKTMLPAKSDMTWSDYHNQKKITKKMETLGQEFIERFTINYERVFERDFGEVLTTDMIDSAGYGWPQPKNDIYPKVQYQPNHAFATIKNAFYAFDNYLDQGRENDWIKHLARDYNFMDYGYRIYIARENVKKNSPCTSFMHWLHSLFS